MVFYLYSQGPEGAVGEPGPPGSEGEKVRIFLVHMFYYTVNSL